MDETDMIGATGETLWPDDLTRPGSVPGPRGDEVLSTPQRIIAAEWALWGKEAHDTGYHVLRCSSGALREKDFSEIITRYSPGQLEQLPQYTVSWIPGADRQPEYLALGVHESALLDPRLADDRSPRDAVGREIVFVRLFCLRYAELAKYARSYQDQALGYLDLFRAVARIQLPAGATELARVTLPDSPAPVPSRGAVYQQAKQVAAVMLTRRQVCVLGADGTGVTERLQFIDTVMGMLPWGLRATMSAATSANSSSQNLKLRLFFASAPRSPGRLASGRTTAEDFLVEWGRLDDIEIADEATRLYQDWLKDVKDQATALLADRTEPVRFTAADIRHMVGHLPRDRSVPDTLTDLARVLEARDQGEDTVRDAVRDAVKRLRRYLAGQDQPAVSAPVQRQYWQIVVQRRLLADHPALSPQFKGQLYDQLLRVAFGPALTYHGYCEIEKSVGGTLSVPLVSALARFRTADWLTYILVRQKQPGFRTTVRALEEAQSAMRGRAAAPMHEVKRTLAARTLQPRHGPAVFDWALRYLRQHSADLHAELAAHGYLVQECAHIYRDDPRERYNQLRRILRFAYGEQLLGKPEIDEIFARLTAPPTTELGQAVVSLTARRNEAYVQQQMGSAVMGAGYGQGAVTGSGTRSRWFWWRPRQRTGRGTGRAAMAGHTLPYPQGEPPESAAGPRSRALSAGSVWSFPKATMFMFLLLILAASFVVFLVVRTLPG